MASYKDKVAEAKRLIGVIDAGDQAATVAAVREALADPEVAKDVLRDDRTLLNVGYARQDLQEQERRNDE